MQTVQTYVYFHTHWDREWYAPFRTYQIRLAHTIDAILDGLEAGLYSCFMLDGQTVLIDDYLEFRPQHRQRLATLIQAGKLRIGPWYVMPDEFLVSGESLIRNLKKGIEAVHQWKGQPSDLSLTGYLPDTFGHSADIPMILKSCGIDTAVVWRGVTPKHSEFFWQSANGDRILTLYLAEGYFQMMLLDGELSEPQQQEALKKLQQKLQDKTAQQQILLPIGGDHLGPLNATQMALLKTTLPDCIETTPDQYLNQLLLNLQDNKTDNNLTCLEGELTDNQGVYLLPGVYSSRLYLKQQNRQLEHRITRRCEPALALTQIAALSQPASNKTQWQYPQAELETAWTLLLKNHPHDSICGCSVDAVHRENEQRFEEVAQITDALTDWQQQALKSIYQPEGSDSWLIVNTLDTPYTGVVYVEEKNSDTSHLHQTGQTETRLTDFYRADIQQIPLSHITSKHHTGWLWVENIPAMGVAGIPKSALPPVHQSVRVSASSLENEFILLTVSPDGSLCIQDKCTGQIFSNQHQITDWPEHGDSYNSAPDPKTKKPATAKLTVKRIRQAGPLVGILELNYTLSTHHTTLPIQTLVQLSAGSPVVEFTTTFTNTQPDHKLQVAFEAAQPVSSLWAESHFNWTNRTYDPSYCVSNHMPAENGKELKPNTGPIQRFIAFDRQALFTKGLTEYEVRHQQVYLTLLRTFDALSSGTTGVRGGQAGPPFATPEGQCLERTLTCEYAWRPLAVNAISSYTTLYRDANRYYGGLSVIACNQTEGAPKDSKPAQPQSLIHWENQSVVNTACYWDTQQQGLIIRLLNTTGDTQRINLQSDWPVSEIIPVNALGQPLKEQSQTTDNILVLKPHNLITALVIFTPV